MMHIYPEGGHGYGLGLALGNKAASTWTNVAVHWLQLLFVDNQDRADIVAK
jgi:hypothetical protein